MKNMMILALPLVLTACQAHQVQSLDYVKPNHVVTEKVMMSPPEPKVKTSFSYQDDPSILKAYDEFSKKGTMPMLGDEGFLTFPYDGRTHIVIACEPLHLCVVQLEEGENINNIDIGDAANWLVSTSLVGTTEKGTYQVTIKPKRYDLATDLVITTTRRTYNLGLVSKELAKTHVVNFYYPLDSLHEASKSANQLKQISTESTVTSLQPYQLNFNYKTTGDTVSWYPTRVFDDGHKTFIELPAITETTELPIFYIQVKKENELINYRYKKPYIIVDGLFKKGVLVSGKGRSQARVIVTNKQYRG